MTQAIPHLNSEDYCQSFSKARNLARHHHFYVGPTNSGKTHHALNVLMQASSGIYLAPLRLLAMEIRDKLMAAGIPCNLITGEERTIIPGAMHTASTIEMMNPKQVVEVAIIDEIQMLLDPERGSAWTAALMGAPAWQVFICGSNAVTKACVSVIEHLNERYQITQLARMTPLVIEPIALCGKRYSKPKLKQQLRAGDAVIAFSRKDVLTLSARFRQWGFSVATIYGALAPEVRRTESERFNSGQANILVATDAIGMGLNLPIRRVIFANIHKFDGSASRPLNATEMRQIAGRAGRYGIYPTGYVNVLEQDEQLHLEHMLSTDDTSDLQKLPISLNFSQLENTARQLNTHKIAECLDYITSYTQLNDGLFTLPSMTTQYAQALLVDAHAPHLALQDKCVFINAPLSLQVNIEKDYFLMCLQSVYENSVRYLPAAPAWLSGSQPQYLEQAEQLTQRISLYAWLSFKFPQIFVDAAQIDALRSSVSRYIERALLIQSGYMQTSRELDYTSRR
ncbi:MAG TPA: helicase-related protein [Methylophilus sp.]